MIEDFGDGAPTASLARTGRIKIGGKGEERQKKDGTGTYRLPVKYDHFVVTLDTRKGGRGNFIPDEEVMQHYGPKPKRLNVMFLVNDWRQVYDDWFAAYFKSTLVCSSDNGKTAIWRGRKEKLHRDIKVLEQVTGRQQGWRVECPGIRCPYYRAKSGITCRCNIRMMVNIMEQSRMGGAYEFRSSSYNSALQLRASFASVMSMTGGQIAGIPLELVVGPHTTMDENGKPQESYVVHFEFPGSPKELMDNAARYRKEIAESQKAMRALPAPQFKLHWGDDMAAEDIVDEFYPETETQEAEYASNEKPPEPPPQEDLDTSDPRPDLEAEEPDEPTQIEEQEQLDRDDEEMDRRASTDEPPPPEPPPSKPETPAEPPPSEATTTSDDGDQAKINRGVGIIKKFINANEGAGDLLPKALEHAGIEATDTPLDDLGSVLTYEGTRTVYANLKRLQKGGK
jgi:hypothetical protein